MPPRLASGSAGHGTRDTGHIWTHMGAQEPGPGPKLAAGPNGPGSLGPWPWARVPWDPAASFAPGPGSWAPMCIHIVYPYVSTYAHMYPYVSICIELYSLCIEILIKIESNLLKPFCFPMSPLEGPNIEFHPNLIFPKK